MLSLTVIIPSYNRALLLDKTLHSLTLQTNMNFKVIVVDHGSTDDTKTIVQKYGTGLSIEYMFLRREKLDSSKPRDVGAKNVDTPLIAFLDCGIVVPSFYVTAHSRFHQENRKHVGLGMYHGHATKDPQDERWTSILERINIDEADTIFNRQLDLHDERADVMNNLPNLNLPWVYGWTGNISMQTEGYLSVNGFDPDQDYGYEDLDIAYKFFKRGFKFAFVKDGWGIHLPHQRPSLIDLQEMEYRGWRRSYLKYRSLALEVVQYASYNKIAEEAFTHLTEIGQMARNFTSIPSVCHRYHFARPALLIGGSILDTQYFDYVTLADENIVSTDSVWSCSGILIPIEGQILETIVVSDIWKGFGCSFNPQKNSLIEDLISEIKRTARKAFFINSSNVTTLSDHCKVPIAMLENHCKKYNLSFEIISIEPRELSE